MATNTDTKRPHFVPACYLQAWADGDDQIAVRRRDSMKTFTPNVINVAVEAGIYGRGRAGQTRERMFGQLEEAWPDLRAALIGRGGAVGTDVRSAVSLFAAIQLARTREHVAQLEFLNSFARFSARRPVEREDIRAFLTERHLRFPPSDREVEAAWTFAYVTLNNGEPLGKDEVMAILLGVAVREIGPRLARFHWTVEHCRRPMLFTSDRPVMCWRPRSARDEYEGIGVETAEEIRMPLTPQDLLVIRPVGLDGGIQQVQPRRFERVNAAVASQCHELVVTTPSRARSLELLPMAKHRPVLRFDMAPGVRQLPDGREEPMGDILHTWIPTRAARTKRH
jgi:hypothetical protein